MTVARSEVRILIAEDDPGVAAVLRIALQRRAYEQIDCVADGAAALRHLAAQRVDVLVCDLEMPVVDGRGVLRGLASAAGEGPAVIVASAHFDEALRRELEGHACVRALLEKPFCLDEFVAQVDALSGG